MREKIEKITDESFSDDLESSIKRYRRGLRKELKEALGITLGELMIDSDFDSNARELFVIDDTKNRLAHQVRSRITNDLLRKSTHWDKICEMRRDKTEDRQKTARLIKKALKELGYSESKITKQRDMALAQRPIYQLLVVAKSETEKILEGELEKMPLWTQFLKHTAGISVLTASKLKVMMGDITRFPQPGKLMKYCGLAVVDGKADRLKRGEEANYKPELKALLLGVLGDNLIKQKSKYRQVYDERRKHTLKNRPKWGIHPTTKKPGYKAHYHKDASRVMVKRFISELWEAAYIVNKIKPPSKPYVVAIEGHDMEPRIVPIKGKKGHIYSWDEEGLYDKDRLLLYTWADWRKEV